MKITKITQQKINLNRCNIYIDEEFGFSCSYEDLVKYSVKANTDITQEELEELIAVCEHSKAYEYILYLLQIKDYTELEIRKKLINRNYSQYTIEKVISKLNKYSFINDKDYAERYMKECLKNKKYGSKKIIYNLKSKGIDDEFINELDMDYETMYKNSYDLAQKKLKTIKDKEKAYEKLYRYLLYRGYTYEMISKVIKDILDK